MMTRRELKWVQKQLPRLEEKGLISPFQTESLSLHFHEQFTQNRKKFLLFLWGSIATISLILVGLMWFLK